MSFKLKALGLGLLAVIVMSAFAVMNATAKTGGHFVAEGQTWNLKVTETGELDPETGKTHSTHMISHGLSGEIGCTVPNYGNPSYTAATQSELTLAPAFAGCITTGTASITVTMNGCHYQFGVAPGTTDATEQTVHLICTGPTPYVQIHHGNCTIKIHPQTIENGITYTKKTAEGKHYLTVAVNLQITTTYHSGICIFTGTNHTATLKGSLTVEAFNAVGEKLNLTTT